MIINKNSGPQYRHQGNKVEKNKEGENQSFHVKHKEKNSVQIVAGMRPVMEALNSGKQIDKIFIQSNLEGQLAQELKQKIKELSLPVQYVPVEKLNRMSDSNHQGIIATISPISYYAFADLLQKVVDEGRSPFFVMLDHVTDVRNLGAIVRTAECAGVDAIVVPDRGSAQVNEDAIKSSSGALLRLPMCRESNLKTVVNLARQYGMQICAATEKGSVSYLSVDFRKPTLLIMGAEDTGISNELLKISDVRASLPIVGEVQSLNVSVAAGVFVYEMLRQRSL
ncbi:MAG: 23S rRNA (guanosine(2251)-2'-O)-methyltransferase RlmB [Bacteroidales bacterium]|nr:23S rRNA (guanosine(2251)-2'-O)-methyltransferase RlmB [Bacteroidales bacterium]